MQQKFAWKWLRRVDVKNAQLLRVFQQNVTSIVGCRSRTITLLTSDATAKMKGTVLNNLN